ncbi:MAG: response regulator transcription factor [Alistipes sp.]|nr:response regulator transcription factor [Alistipes sp.]
MLKCLAIDDEPLALRQLAAYIAKTPYLELAASTTNALEAQRIVGTQPIDLLFCDINMPDLNGLDLVRSLPHPPMVIFTTAYSEHAIEGFRLDAIDYLLKPFDFAEFSRAATKAYSLYELRQQAAKQQEAPAAEPTIEPVIEPASIEGEEKEYLSVKADYKVSLVRTSDILYIESEGEYVRLHLADGSKIMTLFRMKKMEDALPADSFMRIHRCYIVNLNRIKSFVRGRVYLNEKEYLPIGERYKEEFRHHVEQKYKTL